MLLCDTLVEQGYDSSAEQSAQEDEEPSRQTKFNPKDPGGCSGDEDGEVSLVALRCKLGVLEVRKGIQREGGAS
eukprot:754827-Hanusia_phi.AAC.7